jgi:hypothetical protein
MERPAVIRFFIVKGLKAKDIHHEPNSVYGPEALALSMVKKRWRRFQQGRTDLSDDTKSRRAFDE